MSLYKGLLKRSAEGRPLRLGLIGAGKFAAMYLAQALHTPGVHMAGVADLSAARAKGSLASAGWPAERMAAPSLDDALKTGTTYVSEDVDALIADPRIEIIIECTGNPLAAVDHCLKAFAAGKHVINVTVEADALCGLALANKAAQAGVIYSLAYGDQPALVCDLVDWAQTCGFPVTAAGRGHKWLPHYRESTPDTVWDHYGLTPEQARAGGLNPKMFNSFLDGSKPAIESAAIANATGLHAPEHGLAFPPASIDDIPALMRPRAEGGLLDRKGVVEVVSSLTAAGQPIAFDIRMGVWVCIEGETDYVRRCFEEYKVVTDASGRYMCLYKRWHLIGLELGVSVASVGLRGEATGAASCFHADVVATAKRDLAPGEMLDGEGGRTVYGKLMPAPKSLALGGLPLGLSHGVRMAKAAAKDEPLTWAHVVMDDSLPAFRLRKEMEAAFTGEEAGQRPTIPDRTRVAGLDAGNAR
jgi:predicted homoserine dehydrogenase-like protein